MGSTPSSKGYGDGNSGNERDSNYDNSGVIGRTIEGITGIMTATDQVGEADKADREYNDGYTKGEADKKSAE